MRVGSMLSLRIGDRDGQKALRFSAIAGAAIDEGATQLFAASIDELCELMDLGPEARERFARIRERTLFSNGWQSWCFAGELDAEERMPRARIVPNIAVYCDGPGRREARGEVLSRFVTYLRVGDGRLVLASRGSPERATPPVSFRWDRATLALEVEIAAKGARFAAGDLVAEIRVFFREGYFSAKDAIRDDFRDYRHFDRLDFLGPRPGGYESWYNHYTHIDDRTISGDLESIGANDNLINAYYLRRGKPTVFQIDDGWEKSVGQWESDPVKFPRGMRALAEEIEAKGMIPGIWIAPFLATKGSAIFRERPEWILRDARGKAVPAGFNPGWDGVFFCLDISLREVEEYLAGLFDRIVEEWGYRYLKLDFLYAGFLGGARPGNGARANAGAAYEHYDRLMRRLTARVKDSRGRGVAYLGCGAPLEPSFRHFPLMRIGADTKARWEDGLLKYVVRHQGRPAAYTNLTHSIGRSLFDGSIFVNDPDVVFCRTRSMGLSEKEKELVALVAFMLASQIMFSDDPADFGDPEEAAFTARVVGLYDSLAGREYGAERIDRDVYSIFSRDACLRGIVNLSNRAWAASGYDPAKALVLHAARVGEGLAFEPRSISLFESFPRR